MEDIQNITLDIEYGRFRSVAYVTTKRDRIQVILGPLWRLDVYKAREDINKDSLLDPGIFDKDYI